MKNFIHLLIVFSASMLVYSCSYSVLEDFPIEKPSDVSFSLTIEPIFDAQGCTGCHPSTAQLDLKAGNAYASIMDGRVDLAAPENSLIYTKANPDASHPKVYTNQQALELLTWIEEGALNN